MLTRSAVLAATLTVGLVAAVGSSAIAVAVVPGDASGATQLVEAIAAPSQDPAEGSNAWFIESTPVTLTIAQPVVIDGGGDKPAAKTNPTAEHAPTTTPPPAASDTGTENANGGVGVGDSTSPSSPESSVDDKSKEDKAKEDKAKKAAEEQAKKDKKAAEDQAKKDKDDKAKKNKNAGTDQ